jgi:cytochrome b
MAIKSVPVSGAGGAAAPIRILVWDLPVRVTHWLLLVCFVGAYITAEEDSYRYLHITFGYTMAALVCFRIFWGVIGSRHALFKDFVRGPRAVVRYLRSLLTRSPERYIGHNPAGAVAILLLLGLPLIIIGLGVAMENHVGGEWVEEAHGLAANIMIAVIGVHVAGVLIESWIHRENLIGEMFSGRKLGTPAQATRSTWLSIALFMTVLLSMFWWFRLTAWS